MKLENVDQEIELEYTHKISSDFVKESGTVCKQFSLASRRYMDHKFEQSISNMFRIPYNHLL